MSYNPYRENSIEDVLEPNEGCLHPVLSYSHYEGLYEREGRPCRDPDCFKCHKGSGISIEARQHHSKLLQRLPGVTLCALMKRLHMARGTFGEKIKFWQDEAYILGSARDVVYVPSDREIFVVLGQQLPSTDALSKACIGSSYSNYEWYTHAKLIFKNAPWCFKEGPWWDYIKDTLNPELTREVEAAEAIEKARLLTEESRQAQLAANKLVAWADRHRSVK